MSLREEDKQKNACPSRGLGLAAAAIGVGVGAALYYFFSKRPENPDTEGTTSGQWTCESPQTLSDEDSNLSNDYITVSENTTTDTSIHEETLDHGSISSSSIVTISDDTDSSSCDEEEITSPDDSNNSDWTNNSNQFSDHSQEIEISDEDSDGWEVEISLDLPRFRRPPSLRLLVDRLSSPRNRESRERSWTLEECSICFEVILQHQEVMTLPCTHHFHQACILPWLQEQQTCPNCRKNVD